MAQLIDIELIKKWVDISEEELMQRLVKDAIGLQKEAEANRNKARIKKRNTSSKGGLSYAEIVEKFLRNYSYLSKYFSKEEIVETCSHHMDINNLTEETTVRGRRDEKDTLYGVGVFLRHESNCVFTEYKGSWTRDVVDDGTVYMTSYYLQSLYSKKVDEELILKSCPWLTDYEIKVYDINERNDWIFIDIPTDIDDYSTKSLYVPASALFTKNADAIVECHKNYWHEYGSGKYDKSTEAYLASPAVQKFLEKVRQ